MSSTAEEDALASDKALQKRMWIKYYCEECKAWETRELFEAKSGGPQSSPGSTVWSWGCSRVIHYGSFQTFQVNQLNSADGRDVPQLVFPSIESPTFEPQPEQPQTQPTSTKAAEEVSAQHPVHAAQSNGSSQSKRPTVHAAQSNETSQSKRPRRNVRSTYARDSVTEVTSPHSQGGVTSSSRDQVLPEENGDSTVHVENRSKDEEAAADTAGPESPAVIDAERLENGAHKRPRRLTAGDRGLAQALQYEKEPRVITKPLAEVHNAKPAQPSLAAMKRPKRVTAGLRGLLLSAENAQFAPRTAKKEQNTDQVHGVRTRSTAKKVSKKNRKLGELY